MSKFMAVVVFFSTVILSIADQTNMIAIIEVISDNGSSYRQEVRLSDWRFKSESNGYWTVGQIRADEIYCSSNTLHVGEVEVSSEAGGLKVKKLIVDSTGSSDHKNKVKKSDVEITDAGYGIHFNATNDVGSTKGWLQYVDYDGFVQTVQVTASPEIPLEERYALIRAKDAKIKAAKDSFKSKMQANPNSVPALRSAVEKLAEALNIDLSE